MTTLPPLANSAPTPARSTARLGPIEALLLLVAIVWGGSYSAAKIATDQVPVLQFLVLRFGLTFLLLLPALRGLAVVAWPSALAGASLLGANLLAIFVCETFGVSLTTASNAAFLISLCVAFTPLCEWWLLKVRPTGAVLAAAGLLVAVQGPVWAPLPSSASFWGAMAFLVLLCTLLAFFVQNYAASRTSPSRVALLMGSEPLWGALIAVVWLGERLTLQGWLGGLLIVASAWWVTRPRP